VVREGGRLEIVKALLFIWKYFTESEPRGIAPCLSLEGKVPAKLTDRVCPRYLQKWLKSHQALHLSVVSGIIAMRRMQNLSP